MAAYVNNDSCPICGQAELSHLLGGVWQTADVGGGVWCTLAAARPGQHKGSQAVTQNPIAVGKAPREA